MKSKVYSRFLLILVALLVARVNLYSQITGSASVCEGTTGVEYTAPAGWAAYNWVVPGGLTYVNGATPDVILIDWTVRGSYTLSVSDGGNPPTTLTLDVMVNPKAAITPPLDPVTGMPVTLGFGATTGQVYSTEPGMGPYLWTVPIEGTIVGGDPTTQSITVDWTGVKSQQSVSVTLTNPNVCSDPKLTLIVNYFPFSGPIDPATIPQFVDPLPHFAAGLRINAKNGGNLIIKTVPVQQAALPTGMVVGNGTIGSAATPQAGKGNYAAYAISRDNGTSWGIPMWPAQTIEAKQGNQLTVQYVNGLSGKTYADFNIMADQTLMMNGYPMPVNPLTEPYLGPIPMVVHLHGGEIPSNSDGGPNSWFMPDGITNGPGFKNGLGASSLVTYPNQQEAATLWYHPHDDGLTRINVYTGLAGYYFLRGEDEELAKLPGWSGDDLVMEVTPANKTATFNGTKAYLPEIELAIQDRMFDVNGALYWPVAPPNPELHPFWTPEFIGDIFVVNGKTWPYLSVAPRKYRFRILDGCNARWLNMWLVDAADGTTPGPAITVVGVEGGLLSAPVTLDPNSNQYLNIGPGQRADVVIDFTGFTGKTFILKQNAGAPFPFGDPPVPGLTDVIMQFVVNGSMVSAGTPTVPGSGTDMSQLPPNLRPANPMVKLTDFAGKIDQAITPAVHRQIILNEVMSFGGPAAVLVNNTYFEAALAVAGDPNAAGGPAEFPTEGTTEIIEIANVSADAHPMHIHLMQWQLVSRTPIDADRYLQAYAKAWRDNKPGIPPYPAGSMDYPGGAGSPFDYGKEHVLPPAVPIPDFVNTDGAVGGNPAFSDFTVPGTEIPASPEEQGWKDNVTVPPGFISKFVMRVAPTDKPVNAPAADLMFPFDPSLGPGYVWHCHVIDHEDMSMMRPMEILPSPLRLIYPQITTQPVPKTACAGDALTFSVTATNVTTYQWQVSTDGGKIWTNLSNVVPYSGTTTSSMGIAPVDLLFTGYKYRCVLTNATPGAVTNSNPTPLTVNACSISGTLNYNNATLDPLSGFTVSVNGLVAVTDVAGAYTINNVTSGIYPVIVTTPMLPGGINSTDAGAVNAYAFAPSVIPNVRYMAGDVNNSTVIDPLDATAIQNNFVNALPFIRAPWVFWDAAGSGSNNPPPFMSAVNGESVTGFNILGMSTGDFNGSFNPIPVAGGSNVQLNYTGNILTVPSTVPFTLPITASQQLSVGAVSLILNIPSNLVTVQGVSIPGSAVLPTFLSAGSVLKIGWNSTTPVNLLPGDPLVNITMVPKAGFTSLQTLSVSIAANPLNEIADAAFVPVVNAGLQVDQVKTLDPAPSSSLKVTVSPNPATTNILITYQLPAAGNVSITVVASKGQFMKTLFTNVLQGPGTFTWSENISTLLPGQYTVTLSQTVAGKIKTTTTRFVKQ